MAIFSWLTQKLNGVESVVDSSKIKFSSNMSETESVYDEISDLNHNFTPYICAFRYDIDTDACAVIDVADVCHTLMLTC